MTAESYVRHAYPNLNPEQIKEVVEHCNSYLFKYDPDLFRKRLDYFMRTKGVNRTLAILGR